MQGAVQWRSLHAHFEDPVFGEAFLRLEIFPELRRFRDELRAPTFFVRYWEGGNHYRLRLGNIEEAELQRLQGRLEQKASCYSLAPADGDDLAPDNAFLVQTYEPEVTRYGGVAALAVNERLFCKSSTIAMQSLEALHGNFTARLMRAADFMLAAACALSTDRGRVCANLQTYAAMWRHAKPARPELETASAEALVRKMVGVYALTANCVAARTPAGVWRKHLVAAIADFEVLGQAGQLISPLSGAAATAPGDAAASVRAMVGSQIHMLNNRLGVLPSYEAPLANLLVRAVEQCATWPNLVAAP